MQNLSFSYLLVSRFRLTTFSVGGRAETGDGLSGISTSRLSIFGFTIGSAGGFFFADDKGFFKEVGSVFHDSGVIKPIPGRTCTGSCRRTLFKRCKSCGVSDESFAFGFTFNGAETLVLRCFTGALFVSE